MAFHQFRIPCRYRSRKFELKFIGSDANCDGGGVQSTLLMEPIKRNGRIDGEWGGGRGGEAAVYSFPLFLSLSPFLFFFCQDIY